MAAVLLATIGGFGSVFSLLISPEIRAYNRIYPFIDFFSLTAIALAVDSLCKSRERRIVVAVIVLALGLSDQGPAAVNLNTAYPVVAAELPPVQAFVRELESRLPDRAMVLQLPFRTYLNDSGIARMEPYDHLKLYLVSHRIHWSYPALSNAQMSWQQAAARLGPARLPSQLAAEGFAAIVVDRFGYDDNGTSVIDAIRAALGADSVLAKTDRYIALDIRTLVGASNKAVVPLSLEPVAATVTMLACQGPPLMNIEQIGVTRSPFDGRPIHVPGSGWFKVTGWAVDQARASAATGVDVVIDRTPFPSLFGADRNDVADYFKRPSYTASGFMADIPAGTLEKGQHTLSLRVVSAGGECYYESAGIPLVID
jgi:hypothetical protein